MFPSNISKYMEDKCNMYVWIAFIKVSNRFHTKIQCLTLKFLPIQSFWLYISFFTDGKILVSIKKSLSFKVGSVLVIIQIFLSVFHRDRF